MNHPTKFEPAKHPRDRLGKFRRKKPPDLRAPRGLSLSPGGHGLASPPAKSGTEAASTPSRRPPDSPPNPILEFIREAAERPAGYLDKYWSSRGDQWKEMHTPDTPDSADMLAEIADSLRDEARQLGKRAREQEATLSKMPRGTKTARKIGIARLRYQCERAWASSTNFAVRAERAALLALPPEARRAKGDQRLEQALAAERQAVRNVKTSRRGPRRRAARAELRAVQREVKHIERLHAGNFWR